MDTGTLVGTRWEPILANTTERLLEIWGDPDVELLAGGQNGTILRLDYGMRF